MKEDEKFRLKMMETVDEETMEWAQKASTEFAKRMSYYKCAMLEVETRFNVLNEEYILEHGRAPVNSIKSRLKTLPSLREKLERKNIPFDVDTLEEQLNDIAGVRVICSFPEDVYTMANAFLAMDDMGGTKLDAIPFKVLEYLEELDGKIIFLFATVPFQPNEAVRNKVNNNVIPFLPDECDYWGMYLCAAQPSESLVRDLRNLIAVQPDNTRAKHWLDQCEKANGHPDAEDLKKGCLFMRHVLELDI